MADFEIKPRAMICGSYEAEVRKYHKYISHNSGRIWLVADQPNAADNIYVEGNKTDKNTGFQGFGGRVLTFTLVNGLKIQLEGPWHSNAGALFSAIGIDVRDTHLTWGCIGKGWKSGPTFQGTILDVIHMDNEPVTGEFDRIEIMSEKLAKELGYDVYYYSQSQSGSTQYKTQIFPES